VGRRAVSIIMTRSDQPTLQSPDVAVTTAEQLWFTGPRCIELRQVPLGRPGPAQLLIQTRCSAISAGTEMLVYRGQMPQQMALDSSFESMQSTLEYPLQYGYACVGDVIAIGADVQPCWLGKRVFSFQPHVSYYLTNADQLIVVPDDIDDRAAVFLANMETAVNLAHDGAPIIGEQVVVLGQGVVGLLLAGILAQFPLKNLLTLDGFSQRRALSVAVGAQASFDPLTQSDFARHCLGQIDGADLIYEVSGVPEALNLAVELSGFESRIVIGSWYGNKSAVIALGGDAHRNRLQITTSQVSTLASSLRGRWDKPRRFDTAWDMIRRLQPEKLISHQHQLTDAAALYHLLDTNPGDVLQAVFLYQ
jgi:2-desacetyl-2-hydroxyethyl bacteriochlorophyllide A dehydrogenase